MNINFDLEVKRLSGAPFLDGGAAKEGEEAPPLLLKNGVVNCLLEPQQADASAKGATKLELYELARKISAGGEVDLSAEEITKVRERVQASSYGIEVIGAICDMVKA